MLEPAVVARAGEPERGIVEKPRPPEPAFLEQANRREDVVFLIAQELAAGLFADTQRVLEREFHGCQRHLAVRVNRRSVCVRGVGTEAVCDREILHLLGRRGVADLGRGRINGFGAGVVEIAVVDLVGAALRQPLANFR